MTCARSSAMDMRARINAGGPGLAQLVTAGSAGVTDIYVWALAMGILALRRSFGSLREDFMVIYRLARNGVVAAALLIALPAGARAEDPLHAWTGGVDPAALETWVNA